MSVTNIKARQDVPRDVVPGDHVYYRHPEHGATAGEVLAVGKHGFRCRSSRPDAGEDQVLWDSMLGHKARKQRRFVLVDRGEDGALAADEEGKTHFIRGDVARPVAEAEPMTKALGLAEALQLTALELGRTQAEQGAALSIALEPLTKALAEQAVLLSRLIGALTPPESTPP